MGLFSKKKKEEPKGLPLPDFPKLPEIDDLKFPSYEPNIETKSIKKAVEPAQQKEVPLPSKPKGMEERKLNIPVRKQLPKPVVIKEPMKMPKAEVPEYKSRSRQSPVYVKIDDYKRSLENIEFIKNKLEEATYNLERLEKIKEDENNELNEWKQTLAKIKEELYSIDQRLFREI